MQQIISQEKRAIYSNTDAGPFEARLYVNCVADPFSHKMQPGDATLVRHKCSTLARARKWALAVLVGERVP